MNVEQLTQAVMDLREEQAKQAEISKAAFKRIDEHNKLVETVHTLALSIERQTGEIKQLREQQDTLMRDVDGLKGRSGKRWDSVVEKTIMVVVSAIVGGALGMVIGG